MMNQKPMTPIPDTIEQLTPEWLTAALQSAGAIACRVAGAEITRMGEGIGLLSSMARCHLHYDAPTGDEPASVVVKLEPERQRFRDFVEAAHGFEREIRFYRDVGPRVPIRIARLYCGDWDAHRAVIVLEDLGHLQARNQIHGLRHQETVAAVQQIARVHARFWNNDALAALQWMPVFEPRLTSGIVENWPLFEEVYGLRIGADGVALGRRLCGALDWLRDAILARPRTVCHCDFRADNILFGQPCGPDNVPEEVVIIDWQVCNRSLGAADVARVLGGSEPAAERTGHPMEVLNCWHETLRSEGVTDYDFDAALEDLRLGALLALGVPLRVLSLHGPDPGGRVGQLLDTMAIGMFTFALEIDAPSRLPESV